jgi:hypothetical protein
MNFLGNTKRQSSYNGIACYEVDVSSDNTLSAANVNVDNLPSCNALRNAALSQQMSKDSAGFDPLNWIKENPYKAAAAAAVAYFLFFRK